MTSYAGEHRGESLRDVTRSSRDHHNAVVAKRRRQIKLIIIGITLLLASLISYSFIHIHKLTYALKIRG